jgi:predicted regulator of Ras-like GTPase activity (Roadblock/LC7/MglB family)
MARSQIVLSAAQLQKLRACLAWLGREAAVRCGLLVDLSGQDIVHWSVQNNLDVPSIAALAAGDLMATLEIARMLGMKRACNLIIQEHDEQTILISRVGEGLLLLIVTTREVPLGWARLAIKQMSAAMLSIIGEAAMVPPPPAISDDFEAHFAAQLDRIW